MNSRSVRPCLAVLFSVLGFSLAAQPPSTLPPPVNAVAADDPIIPEVKLPNADIDTILGALKIYTGRMIISPGQLPAPAGGFNLMIDTPMRKSEVVRAIESILAVNGIGFSPLGDKFLIVNSLTAIRAYAPEFIRGSAKSLPPSGKIATKIFSLDFLRAQEIQGLVQSTLNPAVGAQIVPAVSTNSVMITDSVINLQRIEDLLAELDRPSADSIKPKFYSLTNSKAADVVTRLRAILGPQQIPQLGQATNYQAVDHSNQIALIADARLHPLFDDLIRQLDVASTPNTKMERIPLKHAKASSGADEQGLMAVLDIVIKGQINSATRANSTRPTPPRPGINQPVISPPLPGAPPGAPAQPIITNPLMAVAAENAAAVSAEFSPLLTYGPDDRSNSIVVSGTALDVRLISELIHKLDVPLPQVRIECVILEVNLENSRSSGISQLGLQLDGDRLIGIVGTASGIGLTGSTDGSFASISRFGGPGSFKQSLDLTGIIGLTTTPRKNNATILSAPSITASHAKEGLFLSSENRPITTGTSTIPSGGVNSTNQTIARQDIGITLTVTPLIGSDGSVQLDIDADVQDVSGSQLINGNPEPVFSHRQAKTTISAVSGGIYVIGGMQRDKVDRTTSRLGPIPFIGDLFGLRTKTVTRTELIFFLRPYVLTNTPADNDEFRKRIEQLPEKDVPHKDKIRQIIDPAAIPPAPTSVIEKIFK